MRLMVHTIRPLPWLATLIVGKCLTLSPDIDAFLVGYGNENCRRPGSTQATSMAVLFVHRFNGGYDPSSPLTWTPQQAAEFTMFHPCEEPKYVGQQLKPAIQHWSGFDLAEFLTRLYLGQPSSADGNNGNDREDGQRPSVVYDPQNVRSPKWNGLNSREGIVALTELLKEALSADALDPREISRFAEAFLLKEYKWPVSQIPSDGRIDGIPIGMAAPPVVEFESDSFYSRGHAVTFAHVLWVTRKESLGTELGWDDLVAMVTLPEFDEKDVVPMQLLDFWKTFVSLMNLTNYDRAAIVQRMALGGWEASKIPIFVSQILPINLDDCNGMLDQWRFLHDKAGLEDRSTSSGQMVSRNYSGRKPRSTSQLFQAMESEFDELVQEYWSRTEVPSR